MVSLRALGSVVRRLEWRPPTRCQVLQFVGVRVDALAGLGSEFTIACMPSVHERINVPVLVRAMFRGGFGRWNYYRTYVELVGARVVVVWNDTSLEAYQLGAHIAVPVMLIQNGVRHDVAPAAGEGLVTLLRRLNLRERPRISHYLGFGEPARALLAPHVDGEFVGAGSYRLNEFASQRRQPSRRDDGRRARIGFIASFPRIEDVPGGRILGNDAVFVRVAGRPVGYADYFGVDAIVLRSLAAVADARGVGLSVIGKRSVEESPEASFFAGSPGCASVEVIAHAPGNGYQVADDFDWLVTVDSTLGYEMLALGHRVAFVSNRFRMLGIDTDEMRFAHPLPLASDGPFWTSATDESGIRDFLGGFLDLGEAEWNDLRGSTVPRLMQLDAGNLALRRLLRSEIGRTR